MGPVEAVVRTTSGLADVEGITPRHYHGANVDASAAAVVNIRDGSSTGKILDTLRAATGAETGTPFSERGITTAGGVFVQILSGTATVTVYVT